MHAVIGYQVLLPKSNDLHTVECFQVFLSNTNNHLIVCTQDRNTPPNRPYPIGVIAEGCYMCINAHGDLWAFMIGKQSGSSAQSGHSKT